MNISGSVVSTSTPAGSRPVSSTRLAQRRRDRAVVARPRSCRRGTRAARHAAAAPRCAGCTAGRARAPRRRTAPGRPSGARRRPAGAATAAPPSRPRPRRGRGATPAAVTSRRPSRERADLDELGGGGRVGRAEAEGRAPVRHRARAAGGLARVADPPAVPDQPVREQHPVGLGDELADLRLDLDRVVARRSSRTGATAARSACPP